LSSFDTHGCLACGLTSGALPLPGGRIFETARWVVEHCVGPLGVGTLVVKPLRHVVHVCALDAEESAELGPLLQRTAGVVQSLNAADQVYVCLWSHAGWVPGHVHFVVQPAWSAQREQAPGPGPALQMAMFREARPLDPDAVSAFAARARQAFGCKLGPVLARPEE
jgi:diadenosine tetraphosphate (Ap4A) HIT family hydrolase